MTVAIGLVCRDGVLVASDSMGSDANIARTTKEVHTVGTCPTVWTSSSSVFVMEEVTTALEKLVAGGVNNQPPAAFAKPILSGVRDSLRGHINPAMRDAYGRALSSTPFPPGTTNSAFLANFLALGYAANTAWFLGFSTDGQINWHTEHRFYAVGSDGEFASVAHDLMSHYMSDDLTLNYGTLLAYRTIDTTIKVSSHGVGPPVQIAVCDNDGPRVLGDENVKAVSTAVERWKELEAETLRATPESAADLATHDLPVLHEDPTG